MSSTAGDSLSPPAAVSPSSNSGEHDHTDSVATPITLPEFNNLSLQNSKIATNAVAKSNDQSKIDDKLSPELAGLNTYGINGRPRFEVVTVRENGRLQMFMVPNRSPQLVTSPVRNGRLRMWLLNDDQRGGERVRATSNVRRSI